jgi:hypothetical protein
MQRQKVDGSGSETAKKKCLLRRSWEWVKFTGSRHVWFFSITPTDGGLNDRGRVLRPSSFVKYLKDSYSVYKVTNDNESNRRSAPDESGFIF